jgi:hypothetical protein
MNLQVVYLKDNYHDYLTGAEVESTLSTKNASMEPGQHVLVFRESIAATANIAITPGKESDNIGVEGLITQVRQVKDMNKGFTVQYLKLKKL